MAHLTRRQQAVTTFCFHGSISTVTFCIQTHRQLGGTVYQAADCSVLVEPWVKGKHVASVMVRVFTVLSVDNVKVKRATKEPLATAAAYGLQSVQQLCQFAHTTVNTYSTQSLFSAAHTELRALGQDLHSCALGRPSQRPWRSDLGASGCSVVTWSRVRYIR